MRATRGLLAAAYCVRQHPLVTFWRRLTRDLREHRKPPLVLVRRGLRAAARPAPGGRRRGRAGLPPVTPDEALRRDPAAASSTRWPRRWPQSAPPAGRAPARPAVVRAPSRPGRALGCSLRPRAYADGTAGRTPERFARRCWRCTAGSPSSVDVARTPASCRGREASAPRRGRWPASCRGSTGAPCARDGSIAPWATRSARDQAIAAAARGRPVPVYVGSRWLPRHVVLVRRGDAERLRVYEPASGPRRRRAPPATSSGASLALGRLVDHPWFS